LNPQIDSKNILGLTKEAAVNKLKTAGYNELPSSVHTTFLMLIWKVVSEPMFLLLVLCAVLYFILGSLAESLMLLSFVLVIMGITFYQEQKSERALLALRKLSSPRAFVIRDGKGMRIAGRDVVPDDYIVINEGDVVPADAVLIESSHLTIDEAILTGESLPVRKSIIINPGNITKPGGDDLPFIYSGTQVTEGRGIAKVVATGINTEIGKIAKHLETVKTERTKLQKETDRIVRYAAIFGSGLSIVIALIYGFTHNDWIQGFLVGIALAMSILPEEIPVILAVFLALGAWRISLQKVLTRRVSAVEALGATTVLCVDKTGTITQNSMSVSQIYAQDECFEIPNEEIHLRETFHQLIEYSILASQRDPFDPMEIAIKQFGDVYLKDTEHLHNNWQLVHQYPLSKELLAISLVWKSAANSHYVIAAKGAPEAIFDLCHLDKITIAKLTKQIYTMADAGLRVLGVAKANFQKPELPNIQHDFNFEFVGLIGLADPVRTNVALSVNDCHTAGIRIIMLTGDYPGTAQHIAKQIGLRNIEQVITGDQLDKMSDAVLAQKISTVNIFARIMPTQKLRLVNALKANHEIVAMTGDGVNDAPALKAAHIGIAMGERGTDVARESSALVLLDDNFATIVSAVKLGRRIFDNIKKAIVYTLAAHIPIIGMALIPTLLHWPLILMPVHIVFLELIIDPSCSIVFEAEAAEKDIMQRPPRNPKEKLFNRKTLLQSLAQGLSVLIISFGIFIIAKYLGYGEAKVRTMTYAMLVISNLALIFTNRSWSATFLKTFRERNAALWWVTGATITLITAIIYTPTLCNLFYFAPLAIFDVLICITAGILCVLWLRILRKIFLLGQL